jgi:hypothetical protein
MADTTVPPPIDPSTTQVTATPTSPTPPAEAVEAMRKLTESQPQAGMNLQLALGVAANPIQQKINESHITQVLNMAGENQANAYKLEIADRVLYGALAIVVLGVGLFIIHMFKEQPTVLGPVLGAYTGFVAGVASGMGIAKMKHK